MPCLGGLIDSTTAIAGCWNFRKKKRNKIFKLDFSSPRAEKLIGHLDLSGENIRIALARSSSDWRHIWRSQEVAVLSYPSFRHFIITPHSKTFRKVRKDHKSHS